MMSYVHLSVNLNLTHPDYANFSKNERTFPIFLNVVF